MSEISAKSAGVDGHADRAAAVTDSVDDVVVVVADSPAVRQMSSCGLPVFVVWKDDSDG